MNTAHITVREPPRSRLFPVDQWWAEAGSRPNALNAGTAIMAMSPQEKPTLYRFMPFCIRWACSATGGSRKPTASPSATPSQG